jgi:LysR family transcriptional regulator, transcriptional activator of nhaA
LFYFWVVAKEGTIVKASKILLLAHPTISGQIRRLEDSLGVKLFARRGRRLVLTEAGQIAFRFADEIFSLGRECLDTLKGRAQGKVVKLSVGVADVISPSLVRRFLEPAMDLSDDLVVVCRADKCFDEFMAELAQYRVDVVLFDRPASTDAGVRVFSHLLGECDTTILAAAPLAAKLRKGFPRLLDGAPFLMPGASSAAQGMLHDWFQSSGLKPKVVAECDDSALTKDFGAAGVGAFAVPSVIEAEVKRKYGVVVVGRTNEVRHQFYAISVERKINHPAVAAILDAAQNEIFKASPSAPERELADTEPQRAAKRYKAVGT